MHSPEQAHLLQIIADRAREELPIQAKTVLVFTLDLNNGFQPENVIIVRGK